MLEKHENIVSGLFDVLTEHRASCSEGVAALEIALICTQQRTNVTKREALDMFSKHWDLLLNGHYDA
jgi:hypothetical protein